MPVRGLPAPLVTTTPVNHRSPAAEALGDAVVGHDLDIVLVRGDAQVRGARHGRFGRRAVRHEEIRVGIMKLHESLFLRKRRQAGGGDGLPVALLLLVRNVEADALGHLGKLFASAPGAAVSRIRSPPSPVITRPSTSRLRNS